MNSIRSAVLVAVSAMALTLLGCGVEVPLESDEGAAESALGTPTGKMCGGIAGIPCPAGQRCRDNPNDSCDPKNGGADCSGICVIPKPKPAACGGIAGLRCPTGQRCIDDPSDSCDPRKGGADCIGICVPTVTPPPHCGGFAGLRCPAGLLCVDDPSDSCDPRKGGADCIGICIGLK